MINNINNTSGFSYPMGEAENNSLFNTHNIDKMDFSKVETMRKVATFLKSEPYLSASEPEKQQLNQILKAKIKEVKKDIEGVINWVRYTGYQEELSEKKQLYVEIKEILKSSIKEPLEQGSVEKFPSVPTRPIPSPINSSSIPTKPSSVPPIPPNRSTVNKFDHYQAKINYAGKQFKGDQFDLKNIDNLVAEETLMTIDKTVMGYKREEAQRFFDFKRDGFMFSSFQDELLEEISQFNPNNINSYLRTINLIKPKLEEWAKNQELEYDFVIPITLNYRIESESSSSIEMSSPVLLMHVDFATGIGGDTKELMSCFKDLWKEEVEKALNSKLTDEQFVNTHIVQMVNVWMPLEEKPTENTLALMVKNSIKSEELIPRPVTFPLRTNNGNLTVSFTSLIVKPSDTHQCVIQSDMHCGDMVIFDTFNTPHTAVIIPRSEAEKNLPRKSIEIRAIFIRK